MRFPMTSSRLDNKWPTAQRPILPTLAAAAAAAAKFMSGSRNKFHHDDAIDDEFGEYVRKRIANFSKKNHRKCKCASEKLAD